MTTKVSSSVIGDRSVGSLQLANTAITAGTYGGTSTIPYITIDDQGRAIEAGNASISVSNTQLSATGTADSTTFLRGDNSWATVPTPTASSLGLGTTDNVQHGSLGIGQAASGVSGEIKANTVYANVSSTSVTFGDSSIQTTASKKVLITNGDIANVTSWGATCGTWGDYSEIEIAYEYSRTAYSSSSTQFVFTMHVNSVQRQFAYQTQAYIAANAQALLRSKSSYELWVGEALSNNYTASGISPLITGRIRIKLPELNNTNISPAGIFVECVSWGPAYNSSDTTSSRLIQAGPSVGGTSFTGITNSHSLYLGMSHYGVSVGGYGKYVIYGVKR